jgi:hypothetical protein
MTCCTNPLPAAADTRGASAAAPLDDPLFPLPREEADDAAGAAV